MLNENPDKMYIKGKLFSFGLIMVEPRTIDNLGLDPSVRFAKDQALYDRSLIKESYYVSKQTEIDVLSPYFTTAFDSIFQMSQRHNPWAFFSMPEGYNDQKMRLFTFQVIPSLGLEEFQRNNIQKIRDFNERIKKSKVKKKKGNKEKGEDWEEDQEKEKILSESKTLLKLLEYLLELDKLLQMINSRRSQYTKG